MTVFMVSTYGVEFLKLSLWLLGISLMNLFFAVIKTLGYEVTAGERYVDYPSR